MRRLQIYGIINIKATDKYTFYEQYNDIMLFLAQWGELLTFFWYFCLLNHN